jgi:hypothetical protein
MKLDFLNLIKIRQEVRIFYMKNYVNFWYYLAECFLKLEIFETKIVEKMQIHIICSITFFSKNRAFYEIMAKFW